MSEQETDTNISLPFAVYTADHGYDWHFDPRYLDVDKNLLNEWRNEAERLRPKYMSSEDCVYGVFVRDGNTLVFRLFIAKEFDSNNRNADYYAFAFIENQDAAKINFDDLIRQPEFHTASHHPPTSIRYRGTYSWNLASDRSVQAVRGLKAGQTLTDFPFGKMGALITAYGDQCDQIRWTTVIERGTAKTEVKMEGWKDVASSGIHLVQGGVEIPFVPVRSEAKDISVSETRPGAEKKLNELESLDKKWKRDRQKLYNAYDKTRLDYVLLEKKNEMLQKQISELKNEMRNWGWALIGALLILALTWIWVRVNLYQQ